MKKVYLLGILLISITSMIRAQSLETIRTYVDLRNYAKAKDEVDKFLADPKNAAKADGWYYKAFIYNVLSRDAVNGTAKNISFNQESFDAIKKYRALDPKEKLTKEEENATLYNVYYGYYDMAVKAYNIKDYVASFGNFNSALDVHDYIYSNKLPGAKDVHFAALDTDIVYNLIILGNELKKSEAEIAGYYKKIVDADITNEKYLEAYEGLVMFYKKNKDQAAFTEYLGKGKKNFPNDPFWEAIDIEYSVDGLTKEALFKKYDELTSKYPNSYVLAFNYGYDLNKYVYADDNKAIDMTAYKLKIPELFKKAIAIKSTTDANMLLANFYYNNSFDLTDQSKSVKGVKPEDINKRKALIADAKNNVNMCIPPAQEAIRLFAAMPKLKLIDKANYKQALDMLSTAFKNNGDIKKADEYEKKKAEVDKL